jgi:hypothetical protein
LPEEEMAMRTRRRSVGEEERRMRESAKSESRRPVAFAVEKPSEEATVEVGTGSGALLRKARTASRGKEKS